MIKFNLWEAKRRQKDAPGQGTFFDEPQPSLFDDQFKGRHDALKKKYPNMLLLYRQGDTYELVYEDAVIASHHLGLPVKDNKVSFGHKDLEKYLHALLRSGTRVAVVDKV